MMFVSFLVLSFFWIKIEDKYHQKMQNERKQGVGWSAAEEEVVVVALLPSVGLVVENGTTKSIIESFSF